MCIVSIYDTCVYMCIVSIGDTCDTYVDMCIVSIGDICADTCIVSIGDTHSTLTMPSTGFGFRVRCFACRGFSASFQ